MQCTTHLESFKYSYLFFFLLDEFVKKTYRVVKFSNKLIDANMLSCSNCIIF